MLEIIALPIHDAGNLKFKRDDLDLLRQVPPTDASLKRAEEIGSWLGDLLAANRRYIGESNAADRLIYDAFDIPESVAQALKNASHTSFVQALDTEQDTIRVNNEYFRSQREVTA